MAFLIGNLIGRLIMSFLIVLVVMVVIKKFDFKAAAQSMKRPGPIVSTCIVFFLGLLGSLAA